LDIIDLKDFLERKVTEYNCPAFIEGDPVSIPHHFSRLQDIEIAGFFAAILAWGQRKTIISKCTELIDRMDRAPYDFVIHHSEGDLRALAGFRHRTFNDTDLLYFVRFFRAHYSRHHSLEDAFFPGNTVGQFRPEYGDGLIGDDQMDNFASPACFIHETTDNKTIERALNRFRTYFFALPDFPERTKKHISSPAQQSACKRLNMYLRWMVRGDDRGVDFGCWKRVTPAQLICPFDVHVERVARKLGLIRRRQADWKTACELTDNLRLLDSEDPVKFDFALFGLGMDGEL